MYKNDYYRYLATLILEIKGKNKELLAHILETEIELSKEEERVTIQSQQAAVPIDEIAVINAKGGFDMIATANILYAETAEHYVMLHMAEEETIKQYHRRCRIGENERLLNACGLIRIHRSYMVHHSQVKNVHPAEMIVTLKNGKQLPLTKNYLEAVLQELHVSP